MRASSPWMLAQSLPIDRPKVLKGGVGPRDLGRRRGQCWSHGTASSRQRGVRQPAPQVTPVAASRPRSPPSTPSAPAAAAFLGFSGS